MTTVENTAESSSARGGKGNPKLLTWDYNREATVQMQDALMSTTSIALMTGNEVKTGAKEVYKREQLIATAGNLNKTKLTLAHQPTGDLTIFKNHDEKTKVVIKKAAISSKEIEIENSQLEKGTPVTVFYNYMSEDTAQTITISADKFPAYIKVVGDTVIRNATTGKDEAFQMIIHKAKVQPSFTLTFQADGDPTVKLIAA